MNIGFEFESFLADRLGLQRVPGSGNKWYNKLDVRGRGTRWSLKATGESGFRVTSNMINEALNVTDGIGGTGETPVWAVRVDEGDFIIMLLEDWIKLVKEEGFSIPPTKTDEKRRRANTPQLLRGE